MKRVIKCSYQEVKKNSSLFHSNAYCTPLNTEGALVFSSLLVIYLITEEVNKEIYKILTQPHSKTY